jgi:glycosyltransferase involved in cell wall biosynthesis
MTLRILTQLNFSAGENPEADSGMRFTARLLRELHRAAGDLHFYVLTPEHLLDLARSHLPSSRMTLIPLSIPPRLHGGDFSFNPLQIYERLNLRTHDIDVLFLNQPETAIAFLNYFNRQTFHLVPAVTYVHWFDTRRPSTPKHRTHHPALLGALSGMAASNAVACNSHHGRELILSEARKWFSAKIVNDLEAKLQVLPPPVAGREMVRPPSYRRRMRRTQRLILVNHRLLRYTGVRQLISSTFPKLWRQRKDFHVALTNPTRVRLPRALLDFPWLTHKTLDPSDYPEQLWRADIVVAPHRATHWSISTLEAVCAGCLPICNREGFFPEMFAPVLKRMPRRSVTLFENYCLYYRQTLTGKISQAIDDLDELKAFRTQLARATRAVYDWSAWTPAWLKMFRLAYDSVPAMADSSPTVRWMVSELKKHPSVSKEEFLRAREWGPKTRALSWTAIRKSLRAFSTDDPQLPELIFKASRKRRAP